MKITAPELEKDFPPMSPPDNTLRRFEKYDRLTAVAILNGGPLNGKIVKLPNAPTQIYTENGQDIYCPTDTTEKDRWIFNWAGPMLNI